MMSSLRPHVDASGIDIVCFSDIFWDFVWQRHQSLLTRFPADWNILFIEPASLAVLLKEPRRLFARKHGRITVISLPALPLLDRISFLRGINDVFIRCWLGTMFLKHKVTRPVLLYYAPRFSTLIGKLGEKLVAYDCADDRMAFSRVPAWMKTYVDDLYARSDVVFVTSESLRKKALEHRKDSVYLISNGVDAGLFTGAREDAPIPEDIKALKKPIIGYFGVIDEWMDTDLIVEMAAAYPDASVVLLGPVFIGTEGQKKLMSSPNIYLPGQKPHDALPGYLKAFDVCIIPFKVNELTQSVNPVKLYEYLAGGKNVVSITMAEVEKYGKIIYIARGHGDFIQKTAEALRNKPDLAGMNAVVGENTWDSKAKAMAEIIIKYMET